MILLIFYEDNLDLSAQEIFLALYSLVKANELAEYKSFNITNRCNKCLSSKSGWSAIEEPVMAALSE